MKYTITYRRPRCRIRQITVNAESLYDAARRVIAVEDVKSEWIIDNREATGRSGNPNKGTVHKWSGKY